MHRNYSSGAIIWGSLHPTEENILLLGHTDIYNHTPVIIEQTPKATNIIHKRADPLYGTVFQSYNRHDVCLGLIILIKLSYS